MPSIALLTANPVFKTLTAKLAFWLIGLLTALASLSGCANAPFYNESRDKQGQALAKSVAEVDLVAVVGELDKKFAALRTLELDNLKARQATNRKLEIARVASSGPDGAAPLERRYVEPLLNRRIERLVGKKLSNEELDGLLVAAADRSRDDVEAARALRTFNGVSGLNLDGCAAAQRLQAAPGTLSEAALLEVAPGRQGRAGITFKDLMAQCKPAPDALDALLSPSGSLVELKSKLDSANQVLDEHAKALNAQQSKLGAQLTEFAALDAQLTPKADDAGFRAQLSAAAERLKTGVEGLRALAGQGGSHAEALARLDALNQVLDAVASGVSDPAQLSASQRQSVALLRLIPSVADEADKLLKDAQRPRLGPLLLAKEQQRLAVEGFSAQLQAQKRRASLRQQQLDAARSELQALARARRVLGPPAQGNGVTVDTGQSINALLADTSEGGRKRAALFHSFAAYFDDAQMHRALEANLEQAYNGVTDDTVMAQSRVAAQMWQSLMANMAAVLGDHHAAGIKPGELAELLKALGLVHLANQVGK